MNSLLGQVHLTLLSPDTSAAAVAAGVRTAGERGLGGVVVAPSLLNSAREASPQGLVLGTVAGFPGGKHHTLIKAAEARLAVQYGAVEVGVTLDPAIAHTDQNAVLAELIAVREAVPHPVQLAVILEPSMLDDTALHALAGTIRLAGADRIILGTGYHFLGGADPADVEVLAQELVEYATGHPGQRILGLSALTDEPTPDMVAALVAAGADRVLVATLAEFPAE
ncbi:2-deoxyribose-5-phosphate aldolase [Corynebacterium sp. A21]|uniref:2-deoxyribose-5-phosphate aldolase n=1 Tax=Corynebacterium sp. A21 TaxID=3457318 RepID=UPI003FD3D828